MTSVIRSGRRCAAARLSRGKLAGLQLTAVMTLLLASIAAAEPAPPAELSPEVQAKIAEAQQKIARHEYQDAVRLLKSADKLADGKCAACELSLARVCNNLGEYKDVAKAVESLERATNDPRTLALAYNELGLSLTGLARNDAKKLAAAEAAFRKALIDADNSEIRLNFGVVLLRESKDPEGIVELQKFVDANPKYRNLQDVRDMIANPLRARRTFFPNIDFATLDGTSMTAASLRGKVVLVDFWGTWCAPCRDSVPGLKAIAHRHAKDPFVLVSISSDVDENVLKTYVAKNEMTWPQVWDAKRDIIPHCGVRAFPTYLVLDPKGEIVFSADGYSTGIDQVLERTVANALKAAR